VSSDPKQFGEKAGKPLRSREGAISDNASQSRRRKVSPRRAEAEFSEQHTRDLALRKTGIPVMNATSTAALSTIHACRLTACSQSLELRRRIWPEARRRQNLGRCSADLLKKS